MVIIGRFAGSIDTECNILVGLQVVYMQDCKTFSMSEAARGAIGSMIIIFNNSQPYTVTH